MIRAPGQHGVVFTDSSDGDVLGDPGARDMLLRSFDVPEEWATSKQVHGDTVVRVSEAGDAGPADALWTTQKNLAIAVFTADCFGVVLKSPGAVGVAHAGWRGARSEIVSRLRQEMRRAGYGAVRAAVGPGIGACCFEVGAEVLEQFPDSQSTTSWGAPSVDLRLAIRDQLEGIETWFSERCTLHESGFFSHRENATGERMAAIGWVP
jgi:YfiH family protein